MKRKSIRYPLNVRSIEQKLRRGEIPNKKKTKIIESLLAAKTKRALRKAPFHFRRLKHLL